MTKKLILILCEPRTGSNLLCEAMESYVDLQCINEFYLSPHINLYVKENQIPDDLPHKRLTRQQQHKLFELLNVEDGDYFDLLVNIYKQPIDSLVGLYNTTDKIYIGSTKNIDRRWNHQYKYFDDYKYCKTTKQKKTFYACSGYPNCTHIMDDKTYKELKAKSEGTESNE